MGWLITGARSRKDMIEHILGLYPQKVDHASSGNELYILLSVPAVGSVQDSGDGRGRVILCYKLSGYDEMGWGYKDMEESMGPYMFNCPERILKQSTDMNENSVKWREECRKLRKSRNAADRLIRKLEVGMKIKTKSFGVLEYLYTYKGIVCRNSENKVYRYARKYLVDAEIIG